jgi:hypothetical protein
MALKAMPARPAMQRERNGGPMTRAVQDVTGAAEALTVGAVHLTHSTLAAAVETVEDVGGLLGSLAVRTVRGAARAASEIGGDVGSLSARTVSATVQATREVGGEVGSLAVDAVEGAGRSLRDALAGTVAGFRSFLAEAGIGGAGRRPLARAQESMRRPLARAGKRTKRAAGARKTAQRTSETA